MAWLHLAGAIWAAFCAVALALALRSNLIHNEWTMAMLSVVGLVLLLVFLALLLASLCRERARVQRRAAADARALMISRAAYVIWLARRPGSCL